MTSGYSRHQMVVQATGGWFDPMLRYLALILAVLASSLSMTEARAAHIAGTRMAAADHCVRASDATHDHHGGVPDQPGHPGMAGMNCALTCAVIIAPVLRFDMPRETVTGRLVLPSMSPLEGARSLIDLPPPKA